MNKKMSYSLPVAMDGEFPPYNYTIRNLYLALVLPMCFPYECCDGGSP